MALTWHFERAHGEKGQLEPPGPWSRLPAPDWVRMLLTDTARTHKSVRVTYLDGSYDEWRIRIY